MGVIDPFGESERERERESWRRLVELLLNRLVMDDGAKE